MAISLIVIPLRWIDPPITRTMRVERDILGDVERTWIPLENMGYAVLLSAVAAEDRNFCDHLGFDLLGIKQAIEGGAQRGYSTITQQTVKNVYLWQGRSWTRKGIETALTPFVELLLPKERILEIYLNVAEFDEGVFGVDAAARRYFGKAPADLTRDEAARLMMVLPSPKTRNPNAVTPGLERRVRQIRSGMRLVSADGRNFCLIDITSTQL